MLECHKKDSYICRNNFFYIDATIICSFASRISLSAKFITIYKNPLMCLILAMIYLFAFA